MVFLFVFSFQKVSIYHKVTIVISDAKSKTVIQHRFQSSLVRMIYYVVTMYHTPLLYWYLWKHVSMIIVHSVKTLQYIFSLTFLKKNHVNYYNLCNVLGLTFAVSWACPMLWPWYYLCYVLGISYDKYGHGIAFVMSLVLPMLCFRHVL